MWRRSRPVAKQSAEKLEFTGLQRLRNVGKMDVSRGDAEDARVHDLQRRQQLIETKLRQRGGAEQAEHEEF
jgi:hypothetical protein